MPWTGGGMQHVRVSLCNAAQVYGDGFRIAMEMFQQRGLKALVEYVIANGRWPDWHA